MAATMTTQRPASIAEVYDHDAKASKEHLEQLPIDSATPLQAEAQLGLFACFKQYRWATFICLCAAVGALSDGFQIQMSGNIVALPGFVQQFGVLQPNGTRVLDPQHVSLWGSLKNVFAMLGAITGSYPADKIGRKWMILVVQIVMIAGAITEQFATTWTHWLAARFLGGYSVGLAQCCISIYVSEMAPTAGRGALVSSVNLGYAIGSFLSSLSLNIVQNLPADKWRNAVLSQFAISAFAILLWCFIPESARWLCRKGKEEQAKKVMRSVYGKVESYDVDQQYRRMCEEINADKVMATLKGGGTYLDVFRGTNFRRLIISCLPWHWQVAIGVPIIGTYSSYFYRLAGFSNPFIGTIATNCVSIIMLFVAVPLIEKLGRRTLLLGASPVCIISLLIMGGVLRAPGSAAVGPVLVTFACIWQAFYSLSSGPLGYVFVVETSTMRLRAKTTGIAIFFIQGMATVYVYIAPIMLNAPGLGLSNTVFFWAGTGTLVYCLVAYFVPETKGRSYTELDELFERKVPAWRFKSTETQEDLQRKSQTNGA